MLLGPGDDAALVRAPDGRVVVSTDVLIEGRHFRRHWSSGYDVGRKAAAQNLADVAAMGAVPTAIVVGLGLPADLPVDWLDGLTEGFRDECALVGASVAGGDITRCDLVVIGVTVLGDLQGRAAVERSGARPGHVVAVAGRLGRSAAGLALLSASHPASASGRVPVTSPSDPRPHLGTPGSAAQARPSADPDPATGAGSSPRPGPLADAGVPVRAGEAPHGEEQPASAGTGQAPGDEEPFSPRTGEQPSAATGRAGAASSPRTREKPTSAAGTAAPASGRAVESLDGTYQELLKEAVDVHRRPRPPYACGPDAARLGASAMIDVSDGLLQDLGHVAKASGVRIDLDPAAFVVPDAVRAAAAELGADPLDWMLTGGEDHALAATFPPEVALPVSWQIIGRVFEGEGVHVRGRAYDLGGWDHFR